MKRHEAERWSNGVILLHWLTAALVCAAIIVAWGYEALERSPLRTALFTAHKSLGITLFALTLVRLAWRWAVPGPRLPRDLPPLQRWLAGATHVLLYAVLVAMPASGFLLASIRPVVVPWFWLVPIPRLLPIDERGAALAEAVHLSLQWLLYALVALHVAGALFHHVVLGDGVLRRMLPSRRGRRDARVPLRGLGD